MPYELRFDRSWVRLFSSESDDDGVRSLSPDREGARSPSPGSVRYHAYEDEGDVPLPEWGDNRVWSSSPDGMKGVDGGVFDLNGLDCFTTRSPSPPLNDLSMPQGVVSVQEQLSWMVSREDVVGLRRLLTPDVVLNLGRMPMRLAVEGCHHTVARLFVELRLPIDLDHMKYLLDMGYFDAVSVYLGKLTHFDEGDFHQLIEIVDDCPEEYALAVLDKFIECSENWKFMNSYLASRLLEKPLLRERMIQKGFILTSESLMECSGTALEILVRRYPDLINEKVLTRIAICSTSNDLLLFALKRISLSSCDTLHAVVKKGDEKKVELLLNYHAPYNDETVVHAVTRSLSMVRLLVQHGIPYNSTRCLEKAIKKHHLDTVLFFLERGATVTNLAIQGAVEHGSSVAIVKVLMGKADLLLPSYLSFLGFGAPLDLMLYLWTMTSLTAPLTEEELQGILRTNCADSQVIIDILSQALSRFSSRTIRDAMTLSIISKCDPEIIAFLCRHFRFNIMMNVRDLMRNTDRLQLFIGSHIKINVVDMSKRHEKEFLLYLRKNYLFYNEPRFRDFFHHATESIATFLDSEMSIEDLCYSRSPVKALYLAHSHSSHQWEVVVPNRHLPSVLEPYSCYGFNLEAYQAILKHTRQAAKREGDPNPELNAYKLAILFESERGALEYVKTKFGKKKRPYHDACLFELPKRGMWNIPTWRKLVEKYHYSPRIMNLLANAPQIERALNGVLPSYIEAEEEMRTLKRSLTLPKYYRWKFISALRSHPDYQEQLDEIYKKEKGKARLALLNPILWEALGRWMPQERKDFVKRYPLKEGSLFPVERFFDAAVRRRRLEDKTPIELLHVVVSSIYEKVEEKYHDFALDCATVGFSSEDLCLAISLLEKPKTECFIPSIKIEGKDLGHPGFTMEVMDPRDSVVFILGKKTGCCQNLNGDARDCVLHGVTSPYGGLIVLKKEGLTNPFVAQSWMGLTEDGELVFDSIEYNIGNNLGLIMKFYEAAAKAMLLKNPRIKRVLFGGGGNTPKKHTFPLLPKRENYSRIIGYKNVGYDSTETRYVLAQQEGLGLSIAEVVMTGTDAYVSPGMPVNELSLHPLDRIAFFRERPWLRAQYSFIPLVEQGFYSSEARERFGEASIPFGMAREMIEKKIKLDDSCRLVLVDNDQEKLARILSGIPLQERARILIGFVENMHAMAGYIEKINGQYHLQVVDSESTGSSPIIQAAQSAFPAIRCRMNTERLQKDYYSCTTFMIKSLMYFAKHGHEMLMRKEEALPAPLLKMAQGLDVPSKMDDIVSFKRGFTLAEYLQRHQVMLKGRIFNTAALRAKYRFLTRLNS